jgi:hypothetical protein
VSISVSRGTDTSTTTSLGQSPWWSNVTSRAPSCTSVCMSPMTLRPARTWTRCGSPTWTFRSAEARVSIRVNAATSRVCERRGPSSWTLQPASAAVASAAGKRRRSLGAGSMPAR